MTLVSGPKGFQEISKPCKASRSKPEFLPVGKPFHVGVIGAGLAGLRCADILLQKGICVTILEARDRVGGRICQSDIAGIPVDLGPNWIHGTEHNPIVDISKRTNTLTQSWDGPQTIIDSSGEELDAETTGKLSDFMWTTVDKALAYSQNHAATIPSDLSLFDYFREELEKTTFTKREREACLELSKLWGSYIGSPVDRQSLKFFFLEECLEGTNLFVASTYRNILKSVASPAVQGADIYFNDPVLSVEARPRDSHADPRVSVSTASGKRYEFDEVVATFPLGWLKQNQSAFLPALPKRLSTAIENISYGLLEKVYVHFPETFWHTATDSTSENTATSQTEEDKAARLQSISAFTQFLNPTYTDHPPTPFWNQECLSLAALPEPCAHPTLLFYTYGPCATQIVNQISSMQPDSKEYYDTLDTFLKPYYSRMPGYNPTSAACKPVAFVATKWQLDPWAGHGSYSNFQVGLEEGDQDIEVMREGLGAERGLWFAGEHTAPFVALGTTVGAYWSGELVAEKVCEALEARKGKEEKGEGPMSSNRAELK